MSSTSWQWAKANPDSAARRIRELERENAALRELTSTLGAPNHINIPVEKWRELREDKERLDWLNIHMECHCHDEDGFHSWLWVKAPATNKDLRAAIDAARKEGQP